jgi:acetylornithine deacetylase/succinyl-diaminopimelate desuccinylase-like protein
MPLLPTLDEQQRYVRELAEFLSIPSISRDPAHGADMASAASWVAGQLARFDARVVHGDGHPVVLAEWLGKPGAPTILVYGHYDVQPSGDLDAWTSPPFEPVVRDGRIYARGATDDKGPVMVALKTAEAFLQQGGLPLNVRFLIEGEEEVGSANLPAFLETHRDELSADLVVSADGAMWRPDEPSISVSAKGLVGVDVTVIGAASDLHSGRHGGAVANPNHALARLLASLHHPDGGVAVDGFYDQVRPLGHADQQALAQVRFDEEDYRRSVGAPALHGEPGHTTLERLWTRPTLEVNGIAGGGSFTVIPGRATAHISCRLVPDQDPDAVSEAIEAHLRRHVPAGVELHVEQEPGAVPAYAIPADHPAVECGLEALRRTYPGTQPILARMGGTLPAATLFEQALGLKTLLFSFSTGDENLHAPDEFFRLGRLEEGMRAWAELWLLLAERPH